MKEEKINIAIVDDHTLFRNGLAALMNEFEELNVIFSAGNGKEMQDILAKSLLPDIILMDINMPEMDGYKASAWLKENYPKIKVLALSMFDDEKAVIGMIKSGACGYVLKESKPREVLEAIQTIFSKGLYINELVSGKLLHSMANQKDAPLLSAREVEFLKLCCSELTYKEIADSMFVSPRTVDNYRESLFQKLNLKSRTGLVLYSIKNQLIQL